MRWLAVLVPCGSLICLLYLLARWRAPFEDVTPPYGQYFPRPRSGVKPLRKVWDGDRWILLHDDD